MRPTRLLLIVLLLILDTPAAPAAEVQVLDERLHHLRIAGPREWTEFPENPEASQLELKFLADKNDSQQALRLRQQDVKQRWNVLLNGEQLGRLRNDENDMVIYFAVAPESLHDGENVLLIRPDQRRRAAPDDIRVGEVMLLDQSVDDALSETTVAVLVVDEDTNRPLPSRITVVNADGALQTPGAVSNEMIAVRPGVVYTASGQASFGLPAGRYTIYAGRGFEYSLARTEINVSAGQTLETTLPVRREVPTEGWVACDTHVHTLTYSGHGDATAQERMITIAGEGVELPIATDHNVHIDHEPLARQMNVRKYFTPVIGNEVTTRVGHFNIFPVRAGARIPDYHLSEWHAIFSEIYGTADVKIAILNHPRDLHGGTRPFGPRLHNAVVGENLAGWRLRANGMEVLNSGATQTDVMRLFHDWMALLNRGQSITPVGSSDSHDVARHFVGQARTYIRCIDRDPGDINIHEAVNNFLQGRVMVSYGLLAELNVEEKYGPGELVPVFDDEIQVAVRVLGPSWVTAENVMLYANGQLVRKHSISPAETSESARGVKWTGTWRLRKPQHDMHLVAIALGPGIDGLYWKSAKAYQPTSPDWKAHVIGCSGAVWVDVDGDGRRTSAYEYASRLMSQSGGELSSLIQLLGDYDEAVSAQAAHLFQRSGGTLLSEASQTELLKATPKTQAGFQSYLEAWRENQMARSQP